MKTCTLCGLTRSDEHFHRQPGGLGGRRARCKPCYSAMERVRYARKRGIEADERRATPREIVASEARESKACTGCGLRKPLTEFYLHKGRRDGRDACCRSCQVFSYRVAAEIERRARISDPNLLDVCDRSERRADLAEIGGICGVREIRRRIARAARVKASLFGGEIPGDALEALCSA